MKSLSVLLALGAATCMAATAFAQTSSPASANADPQLNRREARDYTNLVDRDAAFRNRRMHLECDSIQGDDLRRQCMDSFSASATGSSGSSGLTPTGSTAR
jgi:hypothetical protein